MICLSPFALTCTFGSLREHSLVATLFLVRQVKRCFVRRRDLVHCLPKLGSLKSQCRLTNLVLQNDWSIFLRNQLHKTWRIQSKVGILASVHRLCVLVLLWDLLYRYLVELSLQICHSVSYAACICLCNVLQVNMLLIRLDLVASFTLAIRTKARLCLFVLLLIFIWL